MYIIRKFFFIIYSQIKIIYVGEDFYYRAARELVKKLLLMRPGRNKWQIVVSRNNYLFSNKKLEPRLQG